MPEDIPRFENDNGGLDDTHVPSEDSLDLETQPSRESNIKFMGHFDSLNDVLHKIIQQVQDLNLNKWDIRYYLDPNIKSEIEITFIELTTHRGDRYIYSVELIDLDIIEYVVFDLCFRYQNLVHNIAYSKLVQLKLIKPVDDEI